MNFNENFQVGAGREAFSTGRRMSSLEIDCFSNHLFAMFNRHTSVIWLTPPNSHQPPCVNKIVINKIYLFERTHRASERWRKTVPRWHMCECKIYWLIDIAQFRCKECHVAAFSVLVLMERWFIGDYIISHVHGIFWSTHVQSEFSDRKCVWRLLSADNALN